MATEKRESLDLYWDQIQEHSNVVSNIRELFLMRLSAYRYLAEKDARKAIKAKRFLIETMAQSENEYDFLAKAAFVRKIEHWEFPEILAQRSDDIHAIVYKINFYINGETKTLHEISFFSKDDNQHYIFTHKYDLSALSDQYCNQAMPGLSIRQIGDPVLHAQASDVDDFSSNNKNKIDSQIAILKDVLYKTGGVGIAANQCLQLSHPLKIILAGVDYNNPEHVVKATTRYPSALFPQMQIYINPSITSHSKECETFPEGCLSVQGILRALVLRPSTVTIQYQNRSGSKCTREFKGSDARVMLHELDHIQNGKVYIQRIIEELSTPQLHKLGKLINEILSVPDSNNVINTFLSPVIAFKRDQNRTLIFEDNDVLDVLKKMSSIVLGGISCDLKSELEKRDNHPSQHPSHEKGKSGVEVHPTNHECKNRL